MQSAVTWENYQEEFTQELWDLHLLLKDQFNHIRTGAKVGFGVSGNSGIEEPHTRLSGGALPVDDVLTKAQVFVDLLRAYGQFMPHGQKHEDPKTRPGTGSKKGGTAVPVAALDTATICAMISCYARLVDIFSEIFHYLAKLLQSDIRGGPVQQPLAALPQFRFGSFNMRSGNVLQTTITARIFLHSFQCVEKSMGIGRQQGVNAGSERPPGTVDVGEGGDRTDSDPSIVKDGGDGLHKVFDVVLALEKDGPGGLT
ncbi:hypothetical protein GGS20DRAFT_594771 [Poronia punctata]|nr:hypothetical protein GGS20DRAFT_594771 [Poronia punctata]